MTRLIRATMNRLRKQAAVPGNGTANQSNLTACRVFRPARCASDNVSLEDNVNPVDKLSLGPFFRLYNQRPAETGHMAR